MYDTSDDTTERDATTPNKLSSRADELVDQIVPDDLDWKHLVTTYPRAAVTAAFVGGVVLGRTHGLSVAAALSGYVVGEVTRNVQGLVDDLMGS